MPPSGWVLAVLLVIYIFTGLIGHDPWKHDDALTIGIAHDIAQNGNWLTLQLAGSAYPDAPLYYWLAAAMGKAFSWLLPFHDAARMTSGLFTLLALQFILLAARELHGREHAAAAPLILAGSIGFLFHAHEAQPMLAALAAHTAAYWALALLPRLPRLASAIFGVALAVGFLSNGLLPLLTLAPAAVIAACLSENRRRCIGWLLTGLMVAAIPCGIWMLSAHLSAPEYLASFFQAEIAVLTNPVTPTTNIVRYANLLLWYAWPALPLAAWALWSKRRVLRTPAMALPALSFLLTLITLAACVALRSNIALLLLPPLVLLSVPGVATLRRGAANAFDWFGMVTFTFFGCIAWIGWSALTLGWPDRLARQAVRLAPGFVGSFDRPAVAFALAFTAIWFWMIVTSPRSPMRGIMHWMSGLTLFWLLIASLWMPWIDYGKTFRDVSASLRAALPDKPDCIAGSALPLSLIASLDYFEGIRTVPQKDPDAARCSWLLVQGTVRDPSTLSEAGWRKTWEGNRPTDRRTRNKFHLYQRGKKSNPAPELRDLSLEAEEPDGLAPNRRQPD